jgi:hypothetical protein
MDSDFTGMTVNERLASTGQIDAFEDAARRRDRDEMLRILRSVALQDEDPASSVDLILADPSKYGF